MVNYFEDAVHYVLLFICYPRLQILLKCYFARQLTHAFQTQCEPSWVSAALLANVFLRNAFLKLRDSHADHLMASPTLN